MNNDFEVVLVITQFFGPNKETALRISRNDKLPFVPFIGLELRYPIVGESEELAIEVTDVIWRQGFETLECRGVSMGAFSADSLVELKAKWVKNGFSVSEILDDGE